MTSRPKKKHDPNVVTLAFCRRWFDEKLNGLRPVKCPCCKRPASKSPRRITKKMVVTLVKMHLRHEGDAKVLRDHSGDYAKLRHWGLTEQVVHGKWRLTPLGAEFLRGRVEVRQTAITYNRALLSFDGPPVTVFDCYGSRSGFIAMVARVRAGATK